MRRAIERSHRRAPAARAGSLPDQWLPGTGRAHEDSSTPAGYHRFVEQPSPPDVATRLAAAASALRIRRHPAAWGVPASRSGEA